MEIKTLSPSKLKQSRLCEARLFAQVGDDEYEEEHGEGAKAGILAHEAAKHWYRPDPTWVQEMAKAMPVIQAAIAAVPPQRQLEEWNRLVSEITAKLAAAGIVKHPRSAKQEGESDDDYSKRLINEAFTLALSTCNPKELPSEPESVSDAKDLFGQIVTHYNRDCLNVVFAERRYKGALRNGVPAHLIIDLGVDRGNGVLEVIDYKTGFITMQTEDMYSEDQVLMNLLAVNIDPELAAYPVKKFTYFWVRSEYESGPVEMSMDRLTDYEYWLALKYQYLRDLKEPSETPNRFCQSCGRKWACKKYREMVSEAMGMAAPLAEKDAQAIPLNQVMAQYEKLGGQEKIIEESKKLLAKRLMAELEGKGLKTLEGDTHRVTKVQAARKDYRTVDVLHICNQYGVDAAPLLSPSKKRVEEVFANNVQAMSHLNRNAKVGLNSPSIRVSEISAKKAADSVKKSKPTEAK